LVALLKDYYTGRLKAAVKGGYDFVDVRDVAMGILACFVEGKSGECYILSGGYHTIKELLGLAAAITDQSPIKTYIPYGLARFFAPLEEAWYRKRKIPPLYTAYSLYTLRSNANFSHAKATEQLHYVPRPLFETIKDSYDYLFTHGVLTPKEPYGQI
jgi:dihydroflavonol-4-reductase